jgi:hypothetical protein
MDPQHAHKLQVLWKSARDKYRSFFYVLEEVRSEIGDEALPEWCRDNLHIRLPVISKSTKLLRGTDAEKAKADLAAALAAANKAEKEQRIAETAAKRKEREDAAYQRDLEKAQRAATLDETLSMPAQDELEAYKRKLDSEFDLRVEQRVREALKSAHERGPQASAQRSKHERVHHDEIACEVCGEMFVPTRSDGKTCSNKCRQKLHRLRHRAA